MTAKKKKGGAQRQPEQRGEEGKMWEIGSKNYESRVPVGETNGSQLIAGHQLGTTRGRYSGSCPFKTPERVVEGGNLLPGEPSDHRTSA